MLLLTIYYVSSGTIDLTQAIYVNLYPLDSRYILLCVDDYFEDIVSISLISHFWPISVYKGTR